MADRVQGTKARDTGRDLDALLNDIAAEHGISAVELLGGAVIAEGAWAEHAERVRPWPDVSFGYGQPSVAWAEIAGMERSADTRYRNADTPLNRATAKTYFGDAERALRYVAPRYARLRATWGDAVEAWCRWNKPNMAGRANPNRANYVRALAEAEHYRETEGPMPTDYAIGPGVQEAMRQYADEPKGDEVYLPDGTTSITPGRDRLYFYSKASNQVYAAPKT